MQDKTGHFKAAMFDFDGTITAKGVHHPDEEMVDVLIELGKVMPFSFCTGRQLDSFIRHGMNFLEERLKPEDREVFLSNLHFVGENGAVGFYYDLEKEGFTPFYEVAWPEEFLPREQFMHDLNEVVKDYGSVIFNAHEIVVVARTRIMEFLKENRGRVDEMYALSERIYEITCDYLRGISEDYEQFVTVGNSGIGIVLSPTGGNKDRGIVEFGEFLSKERGMKFDSAYREILVAGDRAEKGGNDYFFLKGEHGTAFTVGNLGEGQWPKPVIVDGQKLEHDEATKWLVRNKILS